MADETGTEAAAEITLPPPPAEGKKGAPGAPAWMATFADLVTLLMCFFV
ncbi:MAG: flagellar motor protein, partial [Proteobacteria bacterium]|nr:flagellar motor protein [Pseudomonadota bacterium]